VALVKIACENMLLVWRNAKGETMNHKTKTIVIGLLFSALISFGGEARCGDAWYAGEWNSSEGHLAYHPLTVAIRVEVVDAATGFPLESAVVTVQGSYVEETISSRILTDPPQPMEYELEAFTESDGVAVFALSWDKEYPWRFGRPKISDERGGWRYADTWIRAVDDIEKVQSIQIRCQDHYRQTLDFNFDQLIEFGQDKTSESQSPDLFDEFEEAWKNEIERSDLHFFKLQLDDSFTDFNNVKCTSPEFFNHIRNEDYGTIYPESVNWQGDGVGPYFVYLVTVELERVRDEE